MTVRSEQLVEESIEAVCRHAVSGHPRHRLRVSSVIVLRVSLVERGLRHKLLLLQLLLLLRRLPSHHDVLFAQAVVKVASRSEIGRAHV